MTKKEFVNAFAERGELKIKDSERLVNAFLGTIEDALLKGEAVIINFRKMEVSDAKRVIDFVVGVTYAINGDVQQIREDIYICSPPNYQVQGSFVEDEDSSY